MNRSQKEDMVSQMRTILQQAKGIVVAHQKLNVSESGQLRKDMREAGANLQIVKNTLALKAVKGTALEGINPYLQGPTVLGYSQDPIAAAKVMSKFAEKNDKLSIVGGFLGGQALDALNVKALANLPSLNELRSKIIAVILAPATKLAILSKEPATRVARVLAARS